MLMYWQLISFESTMLANGEYPCLARIQPGVHYCRAVSRDGSCLCHFVRTEIYCVPTTSKYITSKIYGASDTSANRNPAYRAITDWMFLRRSNFARISTPAQAISSYTLVRDVHINVTRVKWPNTPICNHPNMRVLYTKSVFLNAIVFGCHSTIHDVIQRNRSKALSLF